MLGFLHMTMHEGFSQAPRSAVEKEVSELSIGSKVIRNGQTRTIDSYRQTASGTEITFDDGDVVMLDGDDTLEVPAS